MVTSPLYSHVCEERRDQDKRRVMGPVSSFNHMMRHQVSKVCCMMGKLSFGASALAGKKLLVCKHSKFKFDTVNGIPD